MAGFRRGAAAGLLLICATACATGTEAQPGPIAQTTEAVAPDGVVCNFRDERLVEISGLAASIRHPGVLWTHNDSGDSARIFAVDSRTCKVLAQVRLRGVEAFDTEAIAMGRDQTGNPVVWVGDIGDNILQRSSVQLRSFPEPAELTDQSVDPTSVSVAYADGPHDAEGLLVDPEPGGRAWIVTKKMAAKSGIYALPRGFADQGAVTARKVGTAPAMSTDAAFAPDRSTYVIRTYVDAQQYPAPPPSSDAKTLGVPFQPQGEAVTFSSDSRALYLASEGSTALIRYSLD